MSTLQVGLAVAGGLILGGVVAYNTWNSRRHAPRQAEPAPGEAAGGAPAPESWIEPGLAPAPGDAAEPGRIEPVLDADLEPPAPPERRPALDALIDVITPIALDGRVVSGEALLAALPSTRRVGSKPFAVEAQAEGSSDWEPPRAGRRYTAVQAGVQLANRTGALNEIEFSEFVVKAQRYADAVGGAPEFPDMLHEVARARELDQFASQHDAQLGFTLRARGAAWSPGFIAQQAARLGFVPGVVPGRMVLPAAEAGLPPLLGLAFDAQAALSEQGEHASVREFTLQLDVPQVARQEQAFERLREAAFALAEAMGGVITDDAGQPLQAAMIDSIGRDLERLYDTLEQHDLAAGSPQARRLFS
ncbi:MAG TPA: cell division protein ZipA C-terminal FtsZ-binding domain-containing protein [Ottowia sp.]|uniref:cell division protein ZipA C-terminal FtsZ-binding domain-containing protein n=1 Tax=Ottowia sp. TaxID=1898956 RepID=UPI002B5D6D09|nr:cell division protein ZipA C-terminal FtsZ-binding domain-containing protein [Ottowia sp.]HMN22047.1 cell division protein ZipA C-terminal FtsZ-binding domain-containing protein [Ottowia sp.]